MSRSDQVSRHWLLLQRLEGPRGATLQELAECLPEDMMRHTRTVRRDLEELEQHFPLGSGDSDAGGAAAERLAQRMAGFTHFAKDRFHRRQI